MRLVDPRFSASETWLFPVTPDRIWALLTRPDRYPDWWPWLRLFRAEGIRPKDVTEAWVRAPLGYSLAVRVVVTDAEPPSTLGVAIDGDIEGTAELALSPAGTGTLARLGFEVEVRRPLLIALSGIAHRPLAWGHDRVIRRGVREFRARALGL